MGSAARDWAATSSSDGMNESTGIYTFYRTPGIETGYCVFLLFFLCAMGAAFPFGSGHCLGHMLAGWLHHAVLCVPTSAEEIERETIVHLLRLVIILIVPQL